MTNIMSAHNELVDYALERGEDFFYEVMPSLRTIAIGICCEMREEGYNVMVDMLHCYVVSAEDANPKYGEYCKTFEYAEEA